MRKQFKKALSMVLSAAMVLTLGSGLELKSAKADGDAQEPNPFVYEGALNDWTTGKDGDCRIQIANTWATPAHAVPASLAGLEFTGMEVSFKVTNVEAAIEAANAKITDEAKKLTSVNATLAFNSAKSATEAATGGNSGPANWANEGKGELPGCTDAAIDKDGTYTVSYSGFQKIAFANFVAVRIKDLDSTVEQKANEDGTDKNVIQFSDVKIKVLDAQLAYEDDAYQGWQSATGDGDCRLQLFNGWGGHARPASFDALKFTGIEVSFKATKVAEAIAAANEKITDETKKLKSVTAALNFNSSEGGPSSWAPGSAGCTDATIDKDGEYTVSYAGTTPAWFDTFLAVRIPDLDSTVTKDENEKSVNIIQFSDVKIKVYGYEFAKPEEPIKTPDPGAVKPYDEELWKTPGIHAYISYQTAGKYDYRNGLNPDKKEDPFTITANGDNSTCVDGKDTMATDVILNKDGEYTIAIDGIDLTSATSYNLLAISTDLDVEKYAGVKVSNITLKVDGTAVTKDPIPSTVEKVDNPYYYYPLINIYGDEVDPLDATNALDDGTLMPSESLEITFTVKGLKKALQDLKDGKYVDPISGETVKNDSITDEDIANSEDNSGSSNPSPTPGGNNPSPTPGGNNPSPTPGGNTGNTGNPTPTPGGSTGTGTGTGSQTVGLATGKTFTAGNFKYKVTAAATKAKAGKVTVTGLTKKGKKAKSLSVATASKSGAKYNVTALGKNAFKGAAATKVTLGKNIKKIPAGAFANCKKLSKLTVKGKLSSVAKKAFKGCKKKITVAGGSKKVKAANVKKLKKSGYKKFK